MELSSSSGLNVVGLQVALQIQDLQLILLSQSQQLAQSSISLDDLLVHQALALGVGAHLGGHLAAAQLSTLGHTQEGAESIADLSGLGEHSLLLGLVLTTLGGLAAATLLSLLQLTRDLLLQLLHAAVDGAQSTAQAVHLLNQAVELGHNVDVLLSGGRGLHMADHSSRSRGGHGGSLGGSSGHGGSSRSSGGCGSSSCLATLLGSSGSGVGRAHLSYVGGRGSF